MDDNCKIIVHPNHEHPLQFYKWTKSSGEVGISCQGCKRPFNTFPSLQAYNWYRCVQGCKYYLHKECADLKDQPQMHHPLHPAHPLTLHFNIPYGKTEFICSVCRTSRVSGFFYSCCHSHCDFCLDIICCTTHRFASNKDLLREHEFYHFLHDASHHILSPYIFQKAFTLYDEDGLECPFSIPCNGCGLDVVDTPIFKCKECQFYLHVKCSQIPHEMHLHHFHPQHHLYLLQKSFVGPEELCCSACRKRIEGGFVLHCTECHFNLDIVCAFLEPTMRLDGHEHPLVHFEKIYSNDVLCVLCNSLYHRDSFRCFACNFNIHSQCLSLPTTVDYYDHIHPLNLASSFKKEEYCDVCEIRRDPDCGVYLCEECPFVAHFECVYPMYKSTTQVEASSSRKLEDESDIREEGDNLTVEEDMTVTANEVDSADYSILLQLDLEITELGKVVKQLIIKKRHGEELTEKIEELHVRHADIEGLLRRLNQSSIGTS